MEKASVLYLSMHTLTETSLQLDLPRNIKQSIFALSPNCQYFTIHTFLLLFWLGRDPHKC